MAVFKVEEMEEEDLLLEVAEVGADSTVAVRVVVNPIEHLLEAEGVVDIIPTKTIAKLQYTMYASTTQLEIVPTEMDAGKSIVLGIQGAIRGELWPV